jgi:HD-GYP domain-containing protein (c-di-GMP phosphodiesterase class II)
MRLFPEKKRQVYLFIATFCILLICLGILAIDTYTYNHQQRVIKYNSETTKEEKDSNDCTIEIAPRGGSTDTWTKRVVQDVDGSYVGTLYSGIIYEIVITNNTNVRINDWTLSVNIPDYCYINNAWCGTIEFHQDTGGNEKVQTIDLRNWQVFESDFIVDFIVSQSDLMIPMNEGDYFIYHPSTEVYEDFIAPSTVDIGLYQDKSVDFIAYNPLDNETIVPMEFADIELDYYLHKELTDLSGFWAIMALFAVWVVAFIVIVATGVRVRKFVAQSEHDKIIIEQSMTSFMAFIDAKDPSTNGHSIRVARYSREIAKRMGFSSEECNRVYYIGLMHDCGKIGIPDSILKKPAKLTPEEFEIIKTHTTQGAKILSDFNSIPGIQDGALYHHERYDGQGYPCGLKGDEIPLIARIICVADSFDTMNSKRYYKEKYSKDDIISEMTTNRGTQFDPRIVDIFLSMISDGTIKFE